MKDSSDNLRRKVNYGVFVSGLASKPGVAVAIQGGSAWAITAAHLPVWFQSNTSHSVYICNPCYVRHQWSHATIICPYQQRSYGTWNNHKTSVRTRLASPMCTRKYLVSLKIQAPLNIKRNQNSKYILGAILCLICKQIWCLLASHLETLLIHLNFLRKKEFVDLKKKTNRPEFKSVCACVTENFKLHHLKISNNIFLCI